MSINQDIEVETEIAGNDLELEGFGKGQIEYHLTDKTYQLYRTEMDFNSSIAVEGIEVVTKAKTISIMKTEVVKE